MANIVNPRQVRKGATVRYHLPRGGQCTAVVAGRDSASAFAKAYGPRVKLESGADIGLCDVIEVITATARIIAAAPDPTAQRAAALTCLRAQWRALAPRMATDCMRWNAHRIPGTQQIGIFRSDAVFDVACPVLVANVHAMPLESVIARVEAALKA